MLFFHIYSAEQEQQWDPVTTRAQDISKKFPGRKLVFYMYFQLKATELNAFLKWEIGVKLEFV